MACGSELLANIIGTVGGILEKNKGNQDLPN
jgi:hypothetical protein